MTTRVMMTRAEAEDFLYKEARLLDNNKLYEWRDLMTEDVIYWVPVNDEGSDPLKHLSVIYDDWANLTGRIWRILDSGLNHTQDPPSKMTGEQWNIAKAVYSELVQILRRKAVWPTTKILSGWPRGVCFRGFYPR